MKRKINKTGIVVCLIYCFVMYFILSMYDQHIGNHDNNTRYVLLPIGVVIIKIIFEYIIKKDIFDKEQK
ncbi:hypothetical protein [Mammaliicoccus sciuri]|uniref:hypothetical protein n=1 Tax=Mammaliicoccus sciuri TaxID=1296 RepID=UPI00065C0F67|nr:hypothetical protein [Mammaliicoccus sciuri]PNY95997.1 hypothetical protein CD035_03260 [Mammaliicoccus sciuri]PTJ78736.1 hypothetical protein BUZ84_12030 [Mammaliicoccus sciuri]PTK00383.1 hypothetical protein BUZ87_12410 [Mammaliicoccus sciuri]PTK14129.1 hypothetical protein BUZ90_11785 [Mammaliicoccus sciuri]QDR64587.1 hypothetical protein FPV13_06775 [Mammaliicoccus sciuri]